VSGAGQPYVAYTVWVADPVLFFMPADNCTSYVKRLEGDAWVTTAQLKGKVALNDGIGLALSPTGELTSCISAHCDGLPGRTSFCSCYANLCHM
jgi:hypothetical protein